MANKRKLNLASTQVNKLIAELPGRREKIKAQVQFRTGMLEFKCGKYRNEFDRLQGAKRLTGLHSNVKSRMKGRQRNKTRRSLNGEPAHAIYKTKFEHEILPRTKILL